MEVNTLTTTPSTSTASNDSGLTSDFETFLRMLTTQIQNQDPLSPLEADQFAIQLAQFSMVEQQTKTNGFLEALASATNTNGVADYADLLGRTVEHSSAFSYTGTPIAVKLDQSQTDGTAILAITDSGGRVVFEQTVDATQATFTWSGLYSDGSVGPSGTYTAEMRSAQDGEVIQNAARVTSDVVEITRGTDGILLLLSDGTSIPSDAVVSLRES